MESRVTRMLSVLAVVLACACGKSVDSEYVEAYQAWSAAMCKCVEGFKLPTQVVDGAEVYDKVAGEKVIEAVDHCVAKAGSAFSIKAPGGEPSGLYEESLKEADRAKIEAIRESGSVCERTYLDARREFHR